MKNWKLYRPQIIFGSIIFLLITGGFIYWWNMPRVTGIYNIEVIEKIYEESRTFTTNESRRRACGVTMGMKFDGSMGLVTKYCTDRFLVTWIDDQDYVGIVKQKTTYDNGYVEYKMVRKYTTKQLFDKVTVGKPWQAHWNHEYKTKRGDKATKVTEKKL